MTNTIPWQPAAKISQLQTRARIFKNIRDFFAQRNVMEVETPLLCRTSVSDPWIESIPANYQENATSRTCYLQTSPEYAMKRLLAAGSGDIYQICKAFRQGETGRMHNPEFTILEWYRLGFDHYQLMDEVDNLLQTVLNTPTACRKSYQAVFEQYLHINPLSASLAELAEVASEKNVQVAGTIEDKDTWLQILMSECIEPYLGLNQPCFIHDFPATQASLARIHPTNVHLAARFEVYFHGIELGNGFHELQDEKEQRQRFEKNNATRNSLGLQEMPLDEFFLASLRYGLPECAGVALGIDRLILLATEQKDIREVLSFDFSRS